MIRPECLQRRFPLLVRPTTIDPYKLEAVHVESHFDKIQHFGPRGEDDARRFSQVSPEKVKVGMPNYLFTAGYTFCSSDKFSNNAETFEKG